ncbi:peptidoglycan DD-metalloendopeptidase family protein [Sphingobium sp. AN641]|uniref:murein hydrolase activator EnvC family protein n=1 Tax=Sphingobium sp. AN641 TaxID=3133443 RepID=UPI0030C2F42D
MQRTRIIGALAIASVAAATRLTGAPAQDIILPGTAATSIEQEQAALKAARAQAEDARERSTRLDRQAALAREEADRARRRAAAMAARIQESEAEIQMAQARIAIITRFQRAQAARLATRQEPVVRLTAALQMMARRPITLALVQPGSVADAVHMRAVLSSVLPVIRDRTAGLRAELARSRALRATAEQAARALADSRTQLSERQAALRALETHKRLAARDLRSGSALESDRALALGERARDIVDLMDRIEEAGDLRERLAALPGPILRPARPSEAMPPAEQQASRVTGPPPYRLPVVGQLVTGMGEVADSGIRTRGLTIATQAGAQVVAPTAGRVAFAGPYRGYGQILIIDHGQGWTTLITGLDRLSTSVGDGVRQGDPVGVAGAGRPSITVELRRNGRPIDIVPLVGLE